MHIDDEVNSRLAKASAAFGRLRPTVWEIEVESRLQLTGFSVAFGSTGCSGSGGGRAPFAPLALTLSAGGTNS